MTIVELLRADQDNEATIGRLYVEGEEVCYTLKNRGAITNLMFPVSLPESIPLSWNFLLQKAANSGRSRTFRP